MHPKTRNRFHPPRVELRAPRVKLSSRGRRAAVPVQLVRDAPPLEGPLTARSTRLVLLLGLLAIAGCAREDVVHAADETQANAVLVALDGQGLQAERRGDDAREGGWIVSVRSRDASAARRVLSDQELPRTRAPGLGEVFGKPGMVPTPMEERARYLHALSGELARSVEAIDGVAEARVHLALAPDDPLRAQATPPPRAAVLVKVRPGQRERVAPMVDGVRSLVAGAVAGLDASTVSVVLSESSASPARVAPPPHGRPLLAGLAIALAVAAAAVLGWPLRRRVASVMRRA